MFTITQWGNNSSFECELDLALLSVDLTFKKWKILSSFSENAE